MSELIADCPRCGANRMTFDLRDAKFMGEEYGWQRSYEAFCVCRSCYCSTTFSLKDSDGDSANYVKNAGLSGIQGAVNGFVDIEGFIGLKDMASTAPPEHVPEEIEDVFREAATCMAVECHNAAGTMFRLCIDLATMGMLPEEQTDGLNRNTRRNLGLRLPWLFENGHLHEALRELSHCIKEDGNDGAHAGTLSEDDAADLLDFTCVLLERLYTEPEKLRLAQERRDQRRSE